MFKSKCEMLLMSQLELLRQMFDEDADEEE